MATPIETIDQFLSDYQYRGSYNRTEVVDILLDIRLAITKETHASIQEEPTSPDRSDTDSGEPAHGETVKEQVIVGS